MSVVGVETVYAAPTFSGGYFYPPADNTYDLGSAAYSWRNIYVDTLIYVTGTVMQGDFLPSADDTYDIGEGTTPYEWKDLYLDGIAYLDQVITDQTLTSQTTENKHFDLVFSTDSTYKSGNIMWSGSTASTVLKISGTHDNTEGALYGLAVFLTCDNNYAADGDGAIGVRGLVTLTDTAVTNGDVAGGFFVGKKTGTGDAANSFILQGIEAWSYISGSGVVGTAIGANFGYHADTSADCSASGTVWRGLQVFCDNVSNAAYDAEETTGVYIWPHSGTIDNALCIGTGTGVWTTGIRFVGPGGGTMTTGIKFGGTSAAGTSNLTVTTGIDMSETSGLTTMLVGDTTLTSQTTEGKFLDIAYTTDSTFISGTNITYSGAYTSSVLKIVGTHTGTTGGLHGILIQMIQDQNFTAAAEGIIGIKSYLDMTDSAITEGNFMAGTFIAKKSGSGTMATGAILHGIETWTYCTGTSVVGTMIGGNIGYHADSSGDCSAAGTVWKALQIFVDNGTMSNPAQETCGVDIWLMAGTVDNALKIGPQAGTTFTTGIRFVSGGTVTTGIKFGGQAIGTAGNVAMTTGIDMTEVTGMTDAIKIGAGKITHAYAMVATDENEEAYKLTITDASLASEDMHRGIVVDYTGSGAKTGSAHLECFSADVTLTANTPETTIDGAWMTHTGAPTLGNVIGMDIYFEDLGANVVNLMGMQITINGTNQSSSRNTPLRLTTTGTEIKTGLLMDVLAVVGLDIDGSICSTADIRFQGGTTLLDDGTNLTLAGANLVMPDGVGINTGVANDDYFTIGAVDNDDNLIDVMIQFQGAAAPYFTVGAIGAWKVKFDPAVAGIIFGDSTDSWDLLLRWGEANGLYIRNSADNDYKDIHAGRVNAADGFYLSATGQVIATPNTNAHYYTLQARLTDSGRVEVARVQGDTDPYFSTGGSQEFKFYNSGYCEIANGSYFATPSILGVTSTVYWDMPIGAGGAANAELWWSFRLDGSTGANECGMYGETDGSATVTATTQIWKVPYRDSGANVAEPAAPNAYQNGGLRIESGNDTDRIYFIGNGDWFYCTKDGGLSMTAEERVDPSGHEFQIGDKVELVIDKILGDGSFHAIPVFAS